MITPLHWDFFRSAERGMRASAYDRGVYDESEIELPASVDDNWTGAFFGRVALNVDALREMYDRVPGTSADEFELTMLGSVRPDARRHPTTERHARIIERRDGLLAEIPGPSSASTSSSTRGGRPECVRTPSTTSTVRPHAGSRPAIGSAR